MWSCNKASDLTSILDGPDPINIKYDEIPFTTKSILGDSTLTYNDSSFVPSYFLGLMDDSYFGISTAALNFQVAIFSEPDLAGATLDSVVLSLEYDTTLMRYGALADAPFSFEVFEMTSDIATDRNYYSSSQVEVNPVPIGQIEGIVPNFRDTLFIPEPQALRLDTVAYVPHLRVRLDRIGDDLLQFTPDDFASVEIFQRKFKGLSLRPTSTSEGVVFFEMFSGLTRLNLYYTIRDTSRLLQMPVIDGRCALFNSYSHDITGTDLESRIISGSDNDSIVYIQSMQGPDLLITFDDLSSIENSTINFAELVLNLFVPFAQDTTLYPAIDQMIVQELKDDGTRTDVIDLLFAGGNQLTTFFGGDLRIDEDTDVASYHFNITRHFQKILDGEASNKILVTNLFKGALPNRSILFGKSSNALSAKFKVTHSDIN
ncbi:MAG: DUF4270 family protein [Saprospiraceae bacterium]|nr:DUF4270 family protein [Saprospiraceae bacterium]